jgi:hypothetical protein
LLLSLWYPFNFDTFEPLIEGTLLSDIGELFLQP